MFQAREANYDTDVYLRNFEMKIEKSLVAVKGRVLEPPAIQLGKLPAIFQGELWHQFVALFLTKKFIFSFLSSSGKPYRAKRWWESFASLMLLWDDKFVQVDAILVQWFS